MIYFYQYEILLPRPIYLFSAIITGFIVLVQRLFCFVFGGGGKICCIYFFHYFIILDLYVIVFFNSLTVIQCISRYEITVSLVLFISLFFILPDIKAFVL